jgi:hypothetical protein
MSINTLETRRTAVGNAETALDSLTVYHLGKRLLLDQIIRTKSYGVGSKYLITLSNYHNMHFSSIGKTIFTTCVPLSRNVVVVIVGHAVIGAMIGQRHEFTPNAASLGRRHVVHFGLGLV